MVLMIKKIVLFFLLVISAKVFSQGWVSAPLYTNEALIQKSKELKEKPMYRSMLSVMDTITLDSSGFFDDFSYPGPYPDSTKWMDKYVFVNRTMGIAPPSLGVATFDGVNAEGYPYNFMAGTFSSGPADTLTSKPIDLNYAGDTTVYLSFYYQAQGRGNFPDPVDSLVLEFKAPVTGAWHHVWAHKGLSSATVDSTWKLVMIKVADPEFLQTGFQFRFSNYATLSGNGDQWNIDYVYLKKGRNINDTLFTDLAIVYDTPSLLNTYYAMPWEQYDSTFMRSAYDVSIRNNNTVNSFGSFNYKIFDQNGVQVDTTYTCGNYNYFPFATSGYSTYPQFAHPPVNYKVPALSGKTEYTIESYIGGFPNSRMINDTVRHTQVFDNYYSYDDGSAEISFGLAGFMHAQLAEKFKLRVADTLRAVDFYFNPQWTDASAFTFTLKVWANAGGVPGTLLYANPGLETPIYNMGGHDKFTRYYLDAPLYLAAGTTFYVGMDQNTTQPINIGVDVNTNAQDNTFYNTSGSWSHPPNEGSLMIHPIMGSAAAAVGITETQEKNEIMIYPNPATNELFIAANTYSPNKLTYTILDIFGKQISSAGVDQNTTIDVSALSNGIYFLRIVNGKNITAKKFIIAR